MKKNLTKDNPVKENVFTKDELLEDFNTVYTSIMEKHPMPFSDKKEIEKLAESQKKKIQKMSKMDFIKIISPLVAKVNCGHTRILLPMVPDESPVFPFDIRVIDKEIYIFKDVSGNEIPNGTKILSINNKNAEDIIEEIYLNMPSDGENVSIKEKGLNTGAPFFHFYYYFFDETPQNFLITYSQPGNSMVEEKIIEPKKFHGIKNPDKNEYNPNISFEFFDNHSLLRIPNFYCSDPEEEFKKFGEKFDLFFTELKTKELSTLVLDLRGNDGGHPFPARILLSYLMIKPYRYFPEYTPILPGLEPLTEIKEINKNAFSGKLITLIDGGCFSTTGHVLSILKASDRALMIGQESGGGYLCSDHSQIIVLKNTGINFRLATMSFATSDVGQTKGRGIFPDIPIKYTINDYLNHNDLEMESALKEIMQ